jgi:hypothetical protein
MFFNYFLASLAVYLCVYVTCASGTLVNVSHSPFVCDIAAKLISDGYLRAYLWSKAQHELGIKSDIGELATDPFIKVFYGGRGFGFSAYSIDNIPIFYQRIWKNGNSAIRNTFYNQMISRLPKGFCEQSGVKCNPDMFDYEEEEFESLVRNASTHTKIQPRMFTFVRKPISHFISGLREYYFLRDYHDKHVDIVSPQELGYFLHAFLDVTNLAARRRFVQPYQGHLNIIPHVYPQATTFREIYGPLLIGHLETFDSDWELIQNAFGIKVRINKEAGARVASKDLNKVGEHWNLLAEYHPRFVRALCWLLVPDFLCLNYPFPPACEDVPYTFAYYGGGLGNK